MTEQLARLRINLAQGEFEVEGSEALVRAYAGRFDSLLARLEQAPTPASARVNNATPPPSVESFGEIVELLPRSVTDVDRMLAAGFFLQQRSGDRAFSTGEASRLLTEQGIKVGNPSQCVKQNLVARRVFKHQGRYRVSQTGVEHLRQLGLPGAP